MIRMMRLTCVCQRQKARQMTCATLANQRARRIPVLMVFRLQTNVKILKVMSTNALGVKQMLIRV